MAFFFTNSAEGRTVAFYPSPAGATGTHQTAALDVDHVPMPLTDRMGAHLATLDLFDLLGRGRWGSGARHEAPQPPRHDTA